MGKKKIIIIKKIQLPPLPAPNKYIEDFSSEGEISIGQTATVNLHGKVEVPKSGWVYSSEPIGVVESLKGDGIVSVVLVGKVEVLNTAIKSERWKLLEKGEVKSIYLVR